LSRADLDAYLSYLRAKGRSASTLNLYRHIFLTFLRFMEEQGIAILPGVYRVELAKVPDRPPRPLSTAECRRLERAVYDLTRKKSPANAALDRSWFFILLDGGLRLSEMLTLTVGDWNPQERLLTVRYGKGARQRRVPLTHRTARAIAGHLVERPGLRTDEALLMLHSKPLSAATVRLRLKAFAAAANVVGVHPHRLRHSYATRLLNTGQMPITTLRKLMGHARIDDTMRYVAITDQRVQEDYRAAIAPLQEADEIDWDLWDPAIEEALRAKRAPAPVSVGHV
jgi:site-specific recombinase XerD